MGNKLNYVDACFDLCAAAILLGEGPISVNDHIKVVPGVIRLEDTDIYGAPSKNIGLYVKVFKDNLLADKFSYDYSNYPPYLINMLLDGSQDLSLRIKAVPQMHKCPLGVLLKSKFTGKNTTYMPCAKGEFTEVDRDMVIAASRKLSEKVMNISANIDEDEVKELSGSSSFRRK